MHTLLRDLALLAAVVAAGGWALIRGLTLSGATPVAPSAPIDYAGVGAAATSDHCARRVALSPPNAPARFEFQVDHPAMFLGRRGRPRVRAAMAAGQRPLVQFVVDASGTVVAPSLRILPVAGDTGAVAVAIRTAARGWRYSAAILEGCPVSQLVQTVVEP
jgi:hypothetical protein